MIYRILKIKDTSSNGVVDLLEVVNSLKTGLENAESWGIFVGVFGLATNELYWVLMSSNEAVDPTPVIKEGLANHGAEIVNITHLEPTVRPESHESRVNPGIYVFRWFKVQNEHVEEIADLSKQAWETFEAGFDTEVQGLFAEVDRNTETGTMLLCTWYRNLTVWQDSRAPADEARQLFMKRHQLTLEATPIATRLLADS